MKPLIPYSMQVAMALLTNDIPKANETMAKALGEVSEEVLKLAGSYEAPDLVFVIASMQILSNALASTLDESGQNVLKMLTNITTFITMNTETLKKMMDDGPDQKQ